MVVVWNGDQVAPLFGYLGAASALVFSCFGAAYGTAKSGVGIASMGVMRPELVMKVRCCCYRRQSSPAGHCSPLTGLAGGGTCIAHPMHCLIISGYPPRCVTGKQCMAGSA
jgi:hypothetical protein